jgi:Zn finger protein HypA/HybF involved in hydrogenase expression
MAREQTNPKDKHWHNYHAVATPTTETVIVYKWSCPDCKTVNNTRVNPQSERSKWRCYRGVEARCGKCHGNTIRLTDSKGLTFDPTADD